MSLTVNPRYCITGAPGSGKTSLVHYIYRYTSLRVVHEAAEAVFKRRKAEGDNMLWKNMRVMERDIQHHQFIDMQKGPHEVCVYDRTLVDSACYARHYEGIMSLEDEMMQMRDKYHFNQHVFLIQLNSNPNQHETTEIRQQGPAEARLLEWKMEAEYLLSGYIVHSIPWDCLQNRAERISQIIAEPPQSLAPKSFPLEALEAFADGLYCEGGAFERILRGNQIWTNLCAVLDTPFAKKGIEYAELERIKQKEGYEIKEEALCDLNEHKVNLAYALVIHHYIVEAHRFAQKSSDQPVTVIVHTFRKRDGVKHAALLQNMLSMAFPDLKKIDVLRDASFEPERSRCYFPDHKVTVVFASGLAPEVYDEYQRNKTFAAADIILTFSVNVGFRETWPAGTLLIPNHWIPFSGDKLELNLKHYKGRNHLTHTIGEIIQARNHASAVQRINELFIPKNSEKKEHRAVLLTEADFKKARLLESSGFVFNPSQLVGRYFTCKA